MKQRMSRAARIAILLLALLAISACEDLPLEEAGSSVSSSAQPTAAPVPASWYAVYFTTPTYPDPKIHRGGIDEQLVALIDAATTSIDLADYDFDLESVASALARAAKRGVRVRMVTDTDTFTNDNQEVRKAFATLKKAKIKIVDDQRPGIMHHKFVVIDERIVWTGSTNLTVGDTYRLNNNAIAITSPALARNYTAEFEKMFVDRMFGPHKDSGVPYPSLTIDGATIETYFAPQDDVAARVAERIKQASESIHFMAFSFTHDDIGDAVIKRAKAGVQVAGVFETTGSETKFSEFGRMKRAKLDVLQDGNPYVMHHKVFIIDGRTVIFGSFNFSSNADTDNDENLLIIDDAGLAQAFEEEFQRVRELALHPPRR